MAAKFGHVLCLGREVVDQRVLLQSALLISVLSIDGDFRKVLREIEHVPHSSPELETVHIPPDRTRANATDQRTVDDIEAASGSFSTRSLQDSEVLVQDVQRCRKERLCSNRMELR